MDGEALLSAGRTYLELGRPDEADAFLQRAAEIAEGNAQIHKFLADAKKQLGKEDEARQHYLRAISLDPGYYQAHANLANLLEAENPDTALQHFRQAVHLRPDIAELHDSMGRVFAAKRLDHHARASFLQAIKLKPCLATAHCNLANLFLSEGSVSEAIKHFRVALSSRPDLGSALFGLTLSLIHTRQCAEARQQLTLLRQQPELPSHLLEKIQADLSAAEGDYESALSDYLKLSGRHDLDSDFLRRLHHSLAMLYKQMGNYSAAFLAIERSHGFSKATYDPAVMQRRVDDLIASAQGESIVVSNTEASGPTPVFIFGMPRAGKTLAEKLIGMHPRTYGLREWLSVRSLPLPARLQQMGLVRDEAEKLLTQAELQSLAQDYLDIVEEYLNDAKRTLHGDVTHPITASPDNTWNIGLIHRLFPKSYLIHVRRHPLDLCIDCFFKDFSSGAHAYSNSLENLGRYYVEYERWITHSRDRLKVPMLEIWYEDIVTNPTEARTRLLEHVGLAPQDCTEPFTTDMFSRSHIGSWRNYETQLASLIRQLSDAGLGMD